MSANSPMRFYRQLAKESESMPAVSAACRDLVQGIEELHELWLGLDESARNSDAGKLTEELLRLALGDEFGSRRH